MSLFAGAPSRPLAVLAVVVLGAHALALRGVPPSLSWRHLQRAMTFSVRDVQRPPAAVAEPAPHTQPAPAPQQAAPVQAARAPVAQPLASPSRVRAQDQSAVPAAATVAPLPPIRLPAPATWQYTVTSMARGIARTGTALLAWKPAGDRYEASLQVTVQPSLARTQRSEGSITAAGLEPLRFSDRVRSEEATHFDRSRGRIVFSSNRPDAVLQPGAQDRLSVLLQVAAMIAADRARFVQGATITLQSATTREAVDWTFTVEGDERLVLPAGNLQATKLTRAPQREYDLRIELWIVPGGDYGPVRLRLTPPNGDWLDMQWSGTDKG